MPQPPAGNDRPLSCDSVAKFPEFAAGEDLLCQLLELPIDVRNREEATGTWTVRHTESIPSTVSIDCPSTIATALTSHVEAGRSD